MFAVRTDAVFSMGFDHGAAFGRIAARIVRSAFSAKADAGNGTRQFPSFLLPPLFGLEGPDIDSVAPTAPLTAALAISKPPMGSSVELPSAVSGRIPALTSWSLISLI
jgi:hypothetical protein